MSFFGGNTSLGATSTPAKPGGLFSSFGGNIATATPAFGAQPAATAAPAFGTTPAFGSTSFGVPAATTAPAFGGFGTQSTATASGFGGFGANTSVAPTSGNIFGSTIQTTTSNTNPSFGGFGTATGTAPAAGTTFGGFGTNIGSGTGAFGGFGTVAGTTGNTFAGFGAQSSGFGTTSGTFGSTFGKPPVSTTTPGFGGFGGNTSFMLGQPQQQPPQMSQAEAFAQSIFNVSIYGDERDIIISKWNYLQAMWGAGKAFYSQNAGPVEITPQNYLCRFKAMGYSRLPGKENKMGLVALNFNKPLADIKSQQQHIINSISTALGNKPNLFVHVDASKEHEDKKSQLVIYVTERLAHMPNEPKRIPATDLANYLSQMSMKMQLNNLGIYEVLALVQPDEDQLKEYMENAPKGVDPRIWRQANLDNPEPTKLIPVPMVGFSDLKWRIKCQENETQTHELYLNKVEKDLATLRQRHAAATAKIMEHKRKLAELSHTILKIVVKQECTRKVGLALTPEEEALRSKLENMQALVSAPTQFKGRLSELLSQMRLQRSQYSQGGGSDYTIDSESEEEIKSLLAMQQNAMEVLTETVKKDMQAIQIIMDEMPELVRS